MTRELCIGLAIVNGLQLLLFAFLLWHLELMPEVRASARDVVDALLGARGGRGGLSSGNSWRREPYDG